MNAFARFVSLGLQDADRRVAAALSPPPLDATDRYLRESRLVSAIDRVTLRLRDWWTASEARRRSTLVLAALAGRNRDDRYRAIAVALLTAVGVHVAMTLWQGATVGWFWMVIPSMAAVFASLLAVVSRAVR